MQPWPFKKVCHAAVLFIVEWSVLGTAKQSSTGLPWARWFSCYLWTSVACPVAKCCKFQLFPLRKSQRLLICLVLRRCNSCWQQGCKLIYLQHRELNASKTFKKVNCTTLIHHDDTIQYNFTWIYHLISIIWPWGCFVVLCHGSCLSLDPTLITYCTLPWTEIVAGRPLLTLRAVFSQAFNAVAFVVWKTRQGRGHKKNGTPSEAWRKTRRTLSEKKPLVGEAEMSAEVPSEDSRSTWGWVCPWHESEAILPGLTQNT